MLRCPSCGGLWWDTILQPVVGRDRLINCPICDTGRARAFVSGHPSHPNYQPLIIDAPARQTPGQRRSRRQQQREERARQRLRHLATG